MEPLQKFDKKFTLIKEWYLIIFMTFLLLSRMVCFVDLVSNQINGICYIVGAIMGGLLLVCELLLHSKRYLRFEYYMFALFLLVCFISSIVYREYGLGDNIKTIMWMAIQMFLFTSVIPFGEDKEKNGKTCLNRLMNSLIVVHFVAVFISFGQFLVQSSYVVPDYNDTYDRRQGFVEERLFGVFTDPNYAAIASLLVIAFAVFLLKKVTNKWAKRFYICTIVFNGIYILLSGSRTAFVASCILVPIFAFLCYRNHQVEQGNHWLKKGILLGVGSLIAVVLYLSFATIAFTPIARVTVKIRPYIGLCEFEEEKDISLVREDGREDISNSRFDIWSNVWKLSADNRIVGMSPRNMVPYAKKNYPGSFIATTGYQAHNAYLAVIAGSGILGTIPILLLVIYLIYHVIGYAKLHKNKKADDILLLCLAVIGIIGISGLFLLEMFFVNTITTGVFWMFVGVTFWFLTYANQKSKEEVA